ncbi:MAG: hypothetical protein ACREDE_04030 [Thermoplasmata archaeon]
MSLHQPSRQFLAAALVHLSIAGVLISLGPWDQLLTLRWDALLWLLLVGFVGFTTVGFALHLFPTISRHLLPVGPLERIAFPVGEAGVIVGTFAAGWPSTWGIPRWSFSAGAFLYLVSVLIVLSLFVRMIRSPRLKTDEPSIRPGDRASVPLFIASWIAVVGAGSLFVLSGIAPGPGFGWWLAGVHLFVLGHVVLLVVAVSLRLVPRSLDADPPRTVVSTLATLGVVGSVSVPLGMLLSDPASPVLLEWLALPEAGLAIGLLGLLFFLGLRARTPRAQLTLHMVGVGFFVIGGGLGLWMLSQRDYSAVDAHALVNVVGFLGLTILIMWFGMIAPFQRVSHAWTIRMLWFLSALWTVLVIALAGLGLLAAAPPAWLFGVVGGLFLTVALAWAIGTLPVLYFGLNPLPGIPSSRIREIRERWRK